MQKLNKIRLLAVFTTLVLGLSLLMPFGSIKDENTADKLRESNDYCIEETNLKCSDIVDLSLVEYAEQYYKMVKEYDGNGYYAIYTYIVIGIGVAILLTLLFAGMKKPIVMMIFNTIAIGLFRLLQWDFKERGVVPGNSMKVGYAQYVFWIVAIVLMAEAIWMLVTKRQLKKQDIEEL